MRIRKKPTVVEPEILLCRAQTSTLLQWLCLGPHVSLISESPPAQLCEDHCLPFPKKPRPRLEGPLEIIWCNPPPSRITWSTWHRMAPGGLQIPPDILSITRARPAPGKGPLSSAQLCQHQPAAARRATTCLPPGRRGRRSRTWHREAWEATSKKIPQKTTAAHSMPLRAVQWRTMEAGSDRTRQHTW